MRSTSITHWTGRPKFRASRGRQTVLEDIDPRVFPLEVDRSLDKHNTARFSVEPLIDDWRSLQRLVAETDEHALIIRGHK